MRQCFLTKPVFHYSVSTDAGSSVRLTGGMSSSEGRVEVNHDGEWRPICNDGWGVEEGTTICNQLGFK